jgi:hypothetical protein
VEVHPAVHVEKAVHVDKKEEPTNSAAMSTELPSLPEPVAESKSKAKATTSSKDAARQPRLSLLPEDPPPEITVHRTGVPAHTGEADMPPPPPPIPKSPPPSGPVLPSDDPESK